MAETNLITELGFVGLGKMGGRLAERLVHGGCSVHVYDRNPDAVARLVKLGAKPESSAKAVGDAAEIVFASLPSPEISIDVALGKDGVVHGKRRRIYVETSTSGRIAIQTIAAGMKAAGVEMLDAPVSGGVSGADAGKMAVMLAGPRAVIDEVRPYMDLYGKKFFEISDVPGGAQLIKLLNNMIGAAGIAASFEAMLIGVKAGLDPQVMCDVINASSGRNKATEEKIPEAVITRTFDTGGRVGNRTKEFKLIFAEAEELGVPLFVSSSVSQLFNYAVTQGSINEDTTALMKHMERWVGVEVRKKN